MKKNLFKKIFSLILMLPTLFLMTGCFGNMSMDGTVGDDDFTAVSADKTHTTSGRPFSAAYVVIDVDSSTEFDDSYSASKKTFADLLDRQFGVLAEDIAYRLNAIYGDGSVQPEETKEITFEGDSNKLTISKQNIIDNDSESPFIDNITNLDAWANVAGLTSDSSETLISAFKIQNAIAGGYLFNQTQTVETEDDSTNTQGKFNENINTAGKWNSSATDLQNKVKIALLKGVSQLESDTTGEESKKVIDHLGFTENDVQNMITSVLNNVIGEDIVDTDNEAKTHLKNMVGDSYVITADFMTVKEDNGTTADYDEKEAWQKAHEYKAYTDIVTSVIQSAIQDGQISESVNYYSTLPRVNVLSMDIYTLQGTTEEEVKDAEDEAENPENSDYEYEEGEEVPPLTKYLEDMNIVSIILIPNAVTCSPNKMENGELKADTSVVYDGFILGSIDLAYSGEAGFNSTIITEVEIMAKGKQLLNDSGENFYSDPIEIYGDKIPERIPGSDPTGSDTVQDPNFNVYIDLLPKAYLKDTGTIKKEDMLIGGFDGNKVDDEKYGFNYTSKKTAKGGEYKQYTLKTATDFMGYNNNGVTFNGGNNYVKVNFTFSEIFNSSDTAKTDNIAPEKKNTLLNILAFNPEAV